MRECYGACELSGQLVKACKRKCEKCNCRQKWNNGRLVIDCPAESSKIPIEEQIVEIPEGVFIEERKNPDAERLLS